MTPAPQATVRVGGTGVIGRRCVDRADDGCLIAVFIGAYTGLGIEAGLRGSVKGLEMTLRLHIAGLVGAIALTGLAAEASAQTARTRAPVISLSEASAAQRSAPVAQAPRRGLRWNENGRWGLNFNASEPVGRDSDWGDVEAGAYYRLNPRLSVGAAAGLGRVEQDPARAPETERRSQPRIRLESIFKF